MVKLLTALSYCVGSFFSCVLQHLCYDRFHGQTMLVSAETLNGGWVGMGEWVVTGCVVLPLLLGSLSLLIDLAW